MICLLIYFVGVYFPSLTRVILSGAVSGQLLISQHPIDRPPCEIVVVDARQNILRRRLLAVVGHSRGAHHPLASITMPLRMAVPAIVVAVPRMQHAAPRIEADFDRAALRGFAFHGPGNLGQQNRLLFVPHERKIHFLILAAPLPIAHQPIQIVEMILPVAHFRAHDTVFHCPSTRASTAL